MTTQDERSWMLDEKNLLEACVVAARDAGAEILKLVAAGFEVETKSDQSPVTVCDRAAELVILAALARAAPGAPVIAEEEVAAGRIPAHDDTYFLVDPLDGTKEFVRGGDDYTVNIGLIEGGHPRLGVVFAPATSMLHHGTRLLLFPRGSARRNEGVRLRRRRLYRQHRADRGRPPAARGGVRTGYRKAARRLYRRGRVARRGREPPTDPRSTPRRR